MPRSRANASKARPVLVRGSVVDPRTRSLIVDCPQPHSCAISGCVRPADVRPRMMVGQGKLSRHAGWSIGKDYRINDPTASEKAISAFRRLIAMASEFGKRLTRARNHAGLTQQELAERVPMAQSTLAAAESSGDGSRLTAQLAHHCGVNAYWLATGEGDMLAGQPDQPWTPAGPPELTQALPVVLASLAQIPTARWVSVMAQLQQVATHPEMLDDAQAELLALLTAPRGKQARAA